MTVKMAPVALASDGRISLSELNALLLDHGAGLRAFQRDPNPGGSTIILRAINGSITPALEIVFGTDRLNDVERATAIVLRLAARYRRHGELANHILACVEGELAASLEQTGCRKVGIRITQSIIVYSVPVGAITDFRVEIEHVGYDLRPVVEQFSVPYLSRVREIGDVMALEQPTLARLRDEAVAVGAVGRISRVALSFLERNVRSPLTDIMSHMAVADHLSLSASSAGGRAHPFFVQWWNGRVVLNVPGQRYRCVGNKIVIFDTVVPPSVAMAAKGMRLGDMFDLPLFDPETIMVSVENGSRSSLEVQLVDDLPFFDRRGRVWVNETMHA